LMNNNSGRTLMGNTSNGRLMKGNSGRSLMSNDSGKSLAGAARNHERRARRRIQRSSTCDTNEAQCRLFGNRSASSLGSQMMPTQDASDTSTVVNVRQRIAANQSSSSLGALVKMEDASEQSILVPEIGDVAHNRVKKSSSTSSLGRLMGMEDASERSTVSRRRVAPGNSNSSLQFLRDTLAKDNPRLVGGPGALYGDSASSLFVTGSRIRRRHGAAQ
jgi:hypothetical protein